jgi:hypothetical protein
MQRVGWATMPTQQGRGFPALRRNSQPLASGSTATCLPQAGSWLRHPPQKATAIKEATIHRARFVGRACSS